MKQVLLQWNSKNHGLTVALRSVSTLCSEKQVNIDEVLLLQSQNFDIVQIAELGIYRQLNRQLFEQKRTQFEGRERERIENVYKQTLDLEGLKVKPPITQKRLHIKNVTDYQSIYNAVREYIKTLGKTLQLHINVSPGTPQMHTVWLMLNASGYLPSTVKLWSSQYDRENKRYLFNEIKFKPKTYLSEIFDSAYQKKFSIKINPNDTISSKRQDAENQLKLFASIPTVSILLMGERGVGKTTYVEQLINNKQYPKYKTLPCGIFSEELMRSELFGHEAGAFTGANKKKDGIFHQFKNGGLLFLDEIHDLSKPLQRQLMQVLQSGEFLPIGSNKTEQANFRLITATNLSYEELTQRLSHDFLDRIAPFIVEIPPIRECREDMPRFWADTWNGVADMPLPKSKTLDKFLNSYHFSGNFRDLQRLANYLFAFSKSREYSPKEAVVKSIDAIRKWEIKAPTKKYFEHGKSYEAMVIRFNQELAEWAVWEYGNQKKAAAGLGMSEAWMSKAKKGKSR